MTHGPDVSPAGTAGIVTRTLAAIVDVVVVLVLMGTAFLAVAGVRFLVSPLGFSWPAPSWAQSLAAAGLLAVGYLTAAWATSGRTAGAAVHGLRVRSVGGARLGWFRAALRAALCVAFPPGLAWSAVGRRRRSVQDLLVGSVVVYDWVSPAGGGSGRAEAGHGPVTGVEEGEP